MKRFFTFLFAAVLLSCASSKNYLERSDADKALQDAVKKLNKSGDDEKARDALPILYNTISQDHLEAITALQKTKDAARWDKIVKEYQQLQDAYDAIINSLSAFKLVNAKSYSVELLEAQQAGAEQYYQQGSSYLAKSGRDNAKKAYDYFKKALRLVDHYKDAEQKMQDAYDNAIVNIVINPVQDNSYFFNSGWGNYGYNYSNEYFQQTLVRELGSYKDRYPARFYTDWEARRENVQPDWQIDLRLRNIDIPYPYTNNYSRNVSGQVQSGTDTSGRPVYQTVYATLNISQMSFTARADMELIIRDLATGKNVSYRSIREDYRWQEEKASYTGDSRALSAADWQMINNGNYFAPRKEDVLNELYRKIYPQVKNNIVYAVDW